MDEQTAEVKNAGIVIRGGKSRSKSYGTRAGFKGSSEGQDPRPPTKPFIILLLTSLAFLIFKLLQSPT